ncbi:unnamed protein product [Acanthosepion pharaonis]|uniref:Uncharacterized protein n=1 Tax=Acanthosepion pharaonis TaxID=158019 RepID=A0A812DNE7_ACAPH|nr:unnamed protein product [Sepia pharaonis]
MAVVYNSRLRGFVILDTRGIVTCKLDRIGLKVERVLLYPKYEHRVITLLQYVKKYNCYFVLDKDFIVKVLNKDFEEVYSMDSETIGASFMVFNSVTDELFTGGVGGTKIWQFHKISAEMFNEIKHLSNYRLSRKTTLPKVGGSWVQKIQVNPSMKHLYCCSEMSVHVYNMSGKLLHHFEQAHTMTITSCCYCYKAKVFATSSWDTTVKVWGLNGSLLHTFCGHSKPISNLILHPKNPLLLISSSFDGTIKIWSLETLDQIYNLPVYASDGPMWMFLTEENMISVFNPQEIKLWSLNHFINFWNLTRCPIFHMSLQRGGSQKSTRLMAVGTDSSLRLFSRKNGKKLCTVLPPPCLSPLEQLLDFCYNRELNLVYLLLNPHTIWIYTSRTDPACRLAEWDTRYLEKNEGSTSNTLYRSHAPSDFTVENWAGDSYQCTAICILTSSVVMAIDADQSCPDCQGFLLLGLQDGRILFMDLIIKGLKYLEFKASKDAITALYHDKQTDTLVTKCQLSDHNLIQIWSLPELHLQFNIPCALNQTTWTRLGHTLLTGYKDGHLFWHKLIQTEDLGPLNPKTYPEFKPDLKPRKSPPHQAEILTVDACPSRLLLSSCSSDGNIKIWEVSGTLIREIILDDSLGSICFLNDFGDLLVSFQNHIFCIPHSKVCSPSTPDTFENATSSAEESDIYEDPSITTEGLGMNKQEPEGMDSYLVPYEMDFSKYFLPRRLSQMIAEVTDEQKDTSKVEVQIGKLEFLEENLRGAPTEVYLSPRENLSESWSSTSFLSHTEKIDTFCEMDYPMLNTSPVQSQSSQSSRTNSPIEEIKIQVMDSGVLKEDISPLCTETSQSTNLLDSKRIHFQDTTDDSASSVINSAVSGPNKERHNTRITVQESQASQNVKKTPTMTKKKKRKKFIPRPKKCVNKQDRNCKGVCRSNTDCEAVDTTKNNPDMTSLPTAELHSPQKMSPTLNQEHSLSAIDTLQVTQALNNSQMPDNSNENNRKHSQTAEKKKNKRDAGDNSQNHEYQENQLETENETPEPPKVNDPNIEIKENEIVTSMKDNNSPVTEQKKINIDSDDDDDSPEMKYLPITVKITPHRSEDQVDKVKKEKFLQSKSPSAHPSSYKNSQSQQSEFDIRLDKFAAKFSRGNSAKVLNLIHGRDENTFGEDWCVRQIERHQLRQMQRNLRLKSAERQQQMSAEKKINHKKDYNEKSQKIIAASQIDNTTPLKRTSENEKVLSSAPKGKIPTLRSDQQQYQNSKIPKPGISSLQEKTFEKEIFTSYRLSFQKSQETSPRRPNTSCSQVSSHPRKSLNNTSFAHTKSIPENAGPCQMVVLGDNVIPEYRFPSPLEVRLLAKRFPQMCSRILYQHYMQPHLPNRRITSAPSGKCFPTHKSERHNP